MKSKREFAFSSFKDNKQKNPTSFYCSVFSLFSFPPPFTHKIIKDHRLSELEYTLKAFGLLTPHVTYEKIVMERGTVACPRAHAGKCQEKDGNEALLTSFSFSVSVVPSP